MRGNSKSLDQLYIASRCFSEWDSMVGNDQVRFCEHCQLNVYDISAMTRSQANALIAKTEGRLCTRIFRRADGTIMTRDCPVGLNAIRRRASRTATAIFGALISVFTSRNVAWANNNNCEHYRAKTIKQQSTDENVFIRGTVYYAKDEVLVDANIVLTNEGTKREYASKTNEKGQFEFSGLPAGKYQIYVWAKGFNNFKKSNIALRTGWALQFDVTLHVGSVGGAAFLDQNPTLESKSFRERSA